MARGHIELLDRTCRKVTGKARCSGAASKVYSHERALYCEAVRLVNKPRDDLKKI